MRWICSRQFRGSLPDRARRPRTALAARGRRRSGIDLPSAKIEARCICGERQVASTMTRDAQPRRASRWAQAERLLVSDDDDTDVDADDDADIDDDDDEDFVFLAAGYDEGVDVDADGGLGRIGEETAIHMLLMTMAESGRWRR